MRSIVLIGFMGSGKTAVGSELARLLELEIFDLDAEIESREGASIEMIFADKGEAHFRHIESQYLGELLEDDRIIALGGGAFVDDANINLINNKAISVWLQCPIEICVERCEKDLTERPLFTDKKAMGNLFNMRQQHYQCASIHIDASSGSPTEIAQTIIATLCIPKR